MGDKNKALTKKQLETLRNKLLAEKQALNCLDEELHLAMPDGSDEVDASISDYFNSHLLRFRNREAFYVKKIDKSLKKFEQNEYGKCSDCDYWIKFERLLARPTAELCIVCKEESERGESASFAGLQSKSMGKMVDITGMMA